MKLRVAVQMDPLESINIAGDSSFALMLSAQARGHELWHYDVATLAYEGDGSPQGRITAHAAPVTVQRVERLYHPGFIIDVLDGYNDPVIPAFGRMTKHTNASVRVHNQPLRTRRHPQYRIMLDRRRHDPPGLRPHKADRNRLAGP